MRKVLVSLMVLALVPALAGAAVTNPEGFEGYALTTSWGPWDETGPQPDGWARFGELGDGDPTPAEDNAMGIAVSSVAPNTTQVLKIDTSGNGENLVAQWYASVPDAAVAVTEYSAEFTATDVLFGSEFRASFGRWTAATEELEEEEVAIFELGYGVWWGGGPGLPASTVYAAEYDEEGNKTWNTENISYSYIAGFEPGNDVWYRIEFQDDNVLSKTRARVYDKSTSPGPEEGWTSWLTQDPDIDFADGGTIKVFINGVGEWDNFSMTEDPGGEVCNPGDANNDLLVSADDYASVQGAFGNTGAVGIPGDANCDGLVSADDYASVQSNFGTTYGGATVPEPATMLLLTAGSLLLMKRKRKS